MMTGAFLYFAYGSNMLTCRLRERTPSALPLGNAFVEGYRLTFAKLSMDGSGKCSLQQTQDPADRAYGALYRIAAAERLRLDKAEGLGSGYHRVVIKVTTERGSEEASTYIATNPQIGLLPYDWYKEYVVRGALEHNLPAGYIDALQLAPSKADPDVKRSAEHFTRLSSS